MVGPPIDKTVSTTDQGCVSEAAVALAPRNEAIRPGRFHRGAHSPFAIRWFGMTALWGHVRHLMAVTAASNQLDLRDWMRPEDAHDLLDRVGRVLAASPQGPSLAERLGREVWIDFVADTGDDHDLSLAVGRMLFAEYALAGTERRLPRGDLLIFGGDTAYPAATANELERRLLQPWNSVLAEKADEGPPRVLLAIPGNHDWYDGLDGFGRLFRRSALENIPERVARRPAPPADDSFQERVEGALLRHLHVDEIGESLRLAGEAFESLAALVLRTEVHRARRLMLAGYTAGTGGILLGAPARAGARPLGRRPTTPKRRLSTARLLRAAPGRGRAAQDPARGARSGARLRRAQ